MNRIGNQELWTRLKRIDRSGMLPSERIGLIIDILERGCQHPIWRLLRRICWNREPAILAAWIDRMLQSDFRDVRVTALYFGLCQPKEGGARNGKARWDLEAGATCRPVGQNIAWLYQRENIIFALDNEYMHSPALSQLFDIISRPDRPAGDPGSVDIGYGIGLAYICAVIPDTLRQIGPRLFFNNSEKIAVAGGFQEGDIAFLGFAAPNNFDFDLLI